MRSSPPPSLAPATLTVVMVSLAVIVFVLIAQLIMRRDARRFAEEFALLPTVDAQSVRSTKTSAYARAGLKHFYSDGALMGDDMIFMQPTNNDILCKLGSQAVASAVCRRSSDYIWAVSCRDDTTMPFPSVDCSGEILETALEPNDRRDCTVRVLDSMYRFVKMCTIVACRVSSEDWIVLEPSSPATAVFLLSRPMFVTGPLTQLYAVQWAPDASSQNSIMDFDSSRTASPIKVHLSIVSDPTIWPTGEGMTLHQSIDMVLNNNGSELGPPVGASGMISTPSLLMLPPTSTLSPVLDLTLTSYYMNYLRPLHNPPQMSRGNNNDVRNVLTLYFVQSRAAPRAGAVFQVGGLSVVYQRSQDGSRTDLVVRNGSSASAAATIPVLQQGIVIVTFTTNMIILVSANKHRVCMKHIPGQPMLLAPAAARSRAALIAPPPPMAFPYTNACIPNYADLLFKVGLFWDEL